MLEDSTLYATMLSAGKTSLPYMNESTATLRGTKTAAAVTDSRIKRIGSPRTSTMWRQNGIPSAPAKGHAITALAATENTTAASQPRSQLPADTMTSNIAVVLIRRDRLARADRAMGQPTWAAAPPMRGTCPASRRGRRR